jgi:hypothetical protein
MEVGAFAVVHDGRELRKLVSRILGLLGKSEGQLRAEYPVREAENRLIDFHPGEASDLGFHTHRNVDRIKVLRLKDLDDDLTL